VLELALLIRPSRPFAWRVGPKVTDMETLGLTEVVSKVQYKFLAVNRRGAWKPVLDLRSKTDGMDWVSNLELSSCEAVSEVCIWVAAGKQMEV
jgi:hypothetical protein